MLKANELGLQSKTSILLYRLHSIKDIDLCHVALQGAAAIWEHTI